ncbi:MAG: hypothetical protein QMC95_02940 [Desulfitobacteriaceae bacterium]|nr:hypothetical protein [Desulfitobacteriaceae bacterium]MDI6913160.1 hypothetical protein [Desulfitobacteriaceae bacterium]
MFEISEGEVHGVDPISMRGYEHQDAGIANS